MSALLQSKRVRGFACAEFVFVLLTSIQVVLGATPVKARHGMVVSQDREASAVGATILQQRGNAVDAAVATAFALAVTHPAAGNLGGGGFMLFRTPDGRTEAYDFREIAPAAARQDMFMPEGRYDAELHHHSPLAVGVPGTVAGLHLAWKEHGQLPWERLVAPAIQLARKGFVVSQGLSESLQSVLPRMQRFPASIRQFSKNGTPYQPGDILKQPDLARTLQRIAARGPSGFYEGETADLIEREMRLRGGLITRTDLLNYKPRKRDVIRGDYRGMRILSMSPPSSGGVALVEMLRILEGYDMSAEDFGSARTVHLVAESMRRAFADRAQFLGDPDFNAGMPLTRLISKEHADTQRRSIDPRRASISATNRFEWPHESSETTHLSVVDAVRGAVSLTYTLEDSYGSGWVVPGAGFLLNNEMGDFNPWPGVTSTNGLIGTSPNLVQPGKRMLSSMTPTIVENDQGPVLVLGSPGGRTIISTVLQVLLNVLDFKMNIQEAVDAPRFHHQWLPDVLQYERRGLSPDTIALLSQRGHATAAVGVQGVVAAIRVNHATGMLEGAADRRSPDSAALGW